MQFLSAGDTRCGSGTILIIDASGPPARLHAAICQVAGYDVLMRRPDELRSRLPPGCQPDVVVIDVTEAPGPRPRIPGISPAVPAILISGSRPDAARFADLQYDAVLIRPVHPSQLRDTVREVVAMGRARVRSTVPEAHDRAALPGSDQEYAQVRATSERLRQQSRELREYARQLRSRVWRIGQRGPSRQPRGERMHPGTDATPS